MPRGILPGRLSVVGTLVRPGFSIPGFVAETDYPLKIAIFNQRSAPGAESLAPLIPSGLTGPATDYGGYSTRQEASLEASRGGELVAPGAAGSGG